ncbi:hypothetical protein M422DRAFT_47667 [Sphaerobolus stellatus SS14]|uniref:Uncharacterized protein n=1 Tax=Sphaerobolus stellatus (strain SS14) TaxID=990650 RepID=A0A0C9VA33_SPHS4|nr:hypothetical protein M422DRAFT_47667 [Sphaerobolus stellatus SS14]
MDLQTVGKTLNIHTRYLPTKKEHSRPVAVIEPQGLGSIPYPSYPSSVKVGLSDYDVVEFAPLVWDDEVSSCSSSPSPEESLVAAGNDYVVDTVIEDKASTEPTRNSSLAALSGAIGIASATASSDLCSHPGPYNFGNIPAGRFKRASANAVPPTNMTSSLSHLAPQLPSSIPENTVDPPAKDGESVETTRNSYTCNVSGGIVSAQPEASSGLSTIHPTPYQFGKICAGRFTHGRTNKGDYKVPSPSSSASGALSNSGLLIANFFSNYVIVPPPSSLTIPQNTMAPSSSISGPRTSVESPGAKLLPLLRFDPVELESSSSSDSTHPIKGLFNSTYLPYHF